MMNLLHNIHLMLNLRIHDSVLDELPLQDLLGRILGAVKFVSQHIDSCKSAFADHLALVVLGAALPLLWSTAEHRVVQILVTSKDVRLHNVSSRR